MKIAIDVSQVVYEGSGVGKYVRCLTLALLTTDTTNDYILFGSSLRMRSKLHAFFEDAKKRNPNVHTRFIPLPQTVLEILWNRLHIVPVEWILGNIDIFWSSDWIQPPLSKAVGITTIHDVIVYTFPQETNPRSTFSLKHMAVSPNIVDTQKRRLQWVKKECSHILCDSLSTRNDVHTLLGIDMHKLHVVYPGVIQ